MNDQDIRVSLKKDILSYLPIITSPIGLDKLPITLLTELHEVTRRAALWAKAYNADELED